MRRESAKSISPLYLFITKMIAIVLGFMVGIVLALTGAGGGVLAAPLLVFGMHLSMAQAGPIGLLGVSFAASLGAIMGLRAGIVRYKAALLVACVGVLASPVGLWLAWRLPNRPLSFLFALVLFWVAYRSFGQAQSGDERNPDFTRQDVSCQLNPDTGRFVWTPLVVQIFVLTGMLAGFLSGLLGVGGGFVLVPVLRRFTPLPMKSIVATSLAVIALVSLSTVAVSSMRGNFNWAIGLPFCGGTVGGMLLGRWLARFLAGPHLSRGFAVVTALVALGLMLKAVL